MLKKVLLVALIALVGQQAFAEFNLQYPRTRMFNDIADGSSATEGQRRTRLGQRAGTSQRFGGMDLEAIHGGASLSYPLDYQWKDFLLTTSNENLAGEMYAGAYGVEATIFTFEDFQDTYDHSGPLETDYRLSYTRKVNFGEDVEGAIVTGAYTFYDFSNSYTKLGDSTQGFGKDAPAFSRHSQELSLNSCWFNNYVQSEGFNYYLGVDGWARLDRFGLRWQGSVGIFARKSDLSPYSPNYARVSASVIAQSEYYVAGSSWPGSDFNIEAGWDMRVRHTPLILAAAFEYFYPWGDPNYRDRQIFSMRLEAVF